MLCVKTQKITIFQTQGGANAPPALPNDVPELEYTEWALWALGMMWAKSANKPNLVMGYSLINKTI